MLMRRVTHPDNGIYGVELFLMFSWLSLSTASEVVGVLPWMRIRPPMHWIIVVLLAPLGPLSVLYWLFFSNQVNRALVIHDMAREVLAQRAAGRNGKPCTRRHQTRLMKEATNDRTYQSQIF